MNLRSATLAEIPFLMELERASETAAHWTETQYRQAVRPGSEDPRRLVLVAEAAATPEAMGKGDSGGIQGFLVARHLAPEWELENIVVAAAARRKGLGRQLIEALLGHAREADSEAVFLEVRESNTVARRLYEKAGFRQTGRRNLYYSHPPEDAILYRRILP